MGTFDFFFAGDYPEELRFKPRMVGDPEPPKTPKARCQVEGCRRVVYKSVVCRKHWQAIPIEIKLKRAMDAQMGQQAAKLDTDLAILDLTPTLAGE